MQTKVITSIVGDGRDWLHTPMPEDNVEFVAYTNQFAPHWTIKSPCDIFSEPKKNAKIHKILLHKYEDCDYSIWIDGNVNLLQPVNKIIADLLGDNDLAITQHPNRNNLFEEAEHIKIKKVEYPHIVDRQLERYRNQKEEIIQENKLYFATVLIRKHSKKINRFNDAWWAEICTNSFRDQISLPYVLRQFSDLKINTFNLETMNRYFHRKDHPRITYGNNEI